LLTDYEETCAIYGWLPADVTTGQLEMVGEMVGACPVDGQFMWIRSFNGISPLCVRLINTDRVPRILFSGNIASCGGSTTALVLCDASMPAAATGTGLYIAGASTVSTVNETTSVTVTTFTSTSTLTLFLPTP
jgi:hypothetical protein